MIQRYSLIWSNKNTSELRLRFGTGHSPILTRSNIIFQELDKQVAFHMKRGEYITGALDGLKERWFEWENQLDANMQ